MECEDQLELCPADSTQLSVLEPDPLIGTQLADRYEILSVIGIGGMGVVYKARHATLERLVAIKMLHTHLVSEPDALKRFHREAKAVSRVKHPHTVTLYDFGINAAGQPYIVMDYIDGVSLKRVIKEEGGISIERARHIFTQVADALACAHNEGVIHRDMKPENIMLSKRGDEDDWVEVVDFGISKVKSRASLQTYNITRIGDVCGSPPYMSPEQCLGSLPVDARSDIYSLAVVLYQALSGRLPFKAKSAIEMIDSHLYANPTPLKVATPALAACDALTVLLNKALQKQPEKRHESLQEFVSDLQSAVASDTQRMAMMRPHLQSLHLDSIDDEPSVSSTVLSAKEHNRESTAAGESGSGNWFQSLGKLVMSLLGKAPAYDVDSPLVLAFCPFCGEPLKPQVKFCLTCGRGLQATQELSKLRVLNHVFVWPRAHSPKARQEMSGRAKALAVRQAKVAGLLRVLVILNLLLLLTLVWLETTHITAFAKKRTVQSWLQNLPIKNWK